VLHASGRQFNPLDTIPKELQLSTGAKGQLTLETRGSRFIKYQELKLQELALEVCTLRLAASALPDLVHCSIHPKGFAKQPLKLSKALSLPIITSFA